jgi:hypothetical protein
VNGFSGAVTLSVSGLPAGAAATFSPSSISPSPTGPAVNSTLTVTTGPSTPAGNATLTITGTSGTSSHTATATLTVMDFTLSAAPLAETMTSGGSASYALSLAALNGFSGSVSLGVSGLPAGVTATFNPSAFSPLSTGPGTNSTLTVTTLSSTPAGNNTLTITATSAAMSHTATVTLVMAGPSALSLSPALLDFGTVIVNQQSPSQAVTLRVSNAALSIQGINVTSSAFVPRNQCPANVAGGTQCSVQVFFQPNNLGMLTGTMQIQDDAAGSPHVVQLQGAGSHFVFASGTGNGQAISAGQSASFSVGLQSMAGVNEQVSVSCAAAPPLAACALSQSSFPLNGSLQTFTVTMPTTARSSLLLLESPLGPALPVVLWFGVFGSLLLLLAFFRPNSPASLPSARLMHVLSLAALMALAHGNDFMLRWGDWWSRIATKRTSLNRHAGRSLRADHHWHLLESCKPAAECAVAIQRQLARVQSIGLRPRSL